MPRRGVSRRASVEVCLGCLKIESVPVITREGG
jgi:hypothetical protein